MPHSPATHSFPSTTLWRLALGLCLLALPLAAGCGGKSGSADKGTITGKVTVKGTAPGPGTVIKYTGSDGKDATSSVDGDGAYTVTDVAPGEAKISITGSAQASVAVGGKTGGELPGMAAGKGAAIPPKYATPGTHPNFTVKAGKNENNIDLTP